MPFTNVFFSEQNSTAAQPHIVMIIADDMGYNDISYHNSKIKTPNLGKITKTPFLFILEETGTKTFVSVLSFG